MRNLPLLEISVESAEAAAAAERGGADRVELCAETAVGGVTPSCELMHKAREQVRVPIFAMIRPRAGNFVYSAAEFDAMREAIGHAKRLGMDGAVLGMLTTERRVDVARTRELVDVCKTVRLEVTFHRAIDEAPELREAVQDILATGAGRVLTSGGKTTALEGAERIAELIRDAEQRIVIVPGAGINPNNVKEVAQKTGAREFHSGLSSVLGRGVDAARFEAEVRRLRENLRAVSANHAAS